MIGRGRNLSAERNLIRLEVRRSCPLRLDQFLLQTLAWKSRTRIQRLIREGAVRVNGDRSKPSRRVRLDDTVTLELSSGTGVPDYTRYELEIVYEDAWLVAVNKPPGMLVHPVGRHVYDTLINHMHHRYHEERDGAAGVVPRLCHRIDRDTTGLVVVAKDGYVHREVSFQFENRLVAKEYIALVDGIYPLDEDSIEVPIGEGRCLRSSLDHDVLKPSRTSLRVLKRFSEHTLLRCVPHTGRQNQIRIHLAGLGFPIAGDRRFGDNPPPPGFPRRHLLHSEKLRFYHPRWKSPVELSAPLCEDFRQVLERLSS